MRGHRAGIPRGAGSGRVPFPAQSPVRPESRSRSGDGCGQAGVSIQGYRFRYGVRPEPASPSWQGCRAQSHGDRCGLRRAVRPRLPRRSGRTASVLSRREYKKTTANRLLGNLKLSKSKR